MKLKLERGRGEDGERGGGCVPQIQCHSESHGTQSRGARYIPFSHHLVSPSPPLPFPLSHPRRGLTLYEVLLALLILLGAMTVLAQHITVGSRASVKGQLQTRAALLCEAKLAEVLAGVEPMTPVADRSLEAAGTGWSWTLEVAQGAAADLLDLTVTVRHVDSLGHQNASFTLRRLTRNPLVLLEAANAAATAASSSAATGTGGP